MKRNETNIRKILTRYLGRYRDPAPKDEVSAVEQVWQKLKPEGAGTPMRMALESEPARGWRLPVLALAGVALVVLVSAVLVRDFVWTDSVHAIVEMTDGEMVRVSGDKTQSVHNGESVGVNETVRSMGGGAMLTLADGSRVEMRAQSELSLERADGGARIRLNNGSVIVNSAQQQTGQLSVQTKDVTVSGLGTVFLVNAEETGSRVAVIQGEGRVQQGATEKSLKPGEQLSTNPQIPSQSVKDELGWSQRADEHVALWTQAAARPSRVVQTVPDPKDAFEVAALKGVTAGPRGARGDIPYPCNGSGPQINPGRFYVGYISLYRLISWAYGRDCIAMEKTGLLSGGPSWIRTTPFEVQATIPAGSPSYSVQQFLAGDAPKLQKMLQNLLAERFKLTMHSEMKDVSVFDLVKGKDTGRLKLSDDQTPLDPAAPLNSQARGILLISTNRATGVMSISANATSIARLLETFRVMSDRPVVDKTDLKGFYDIAPFQMAPDIDAVPAGAPAPLPGGVNSSQLPRILEQLGLKLESSRASMEVQVIDRVERPSEN